VLGAGQLPLAALGSAIIGIVLIAFVSRNVAETPYMVIVNCDDEAAEGNALGMMKRVYPKVHLKSKTVSAGKGIELVSEIRMKGGETTFVNELSAIAGVSNAVLVSFNAEYASFHHYSGLIEEDYL